MAVVQSRTPYANIRHVRAMLEAQMGVGEIVFLDSAHANASDSNAGTDPNYPLATVNGAVDAVTADNHDVIVVLPTHAETISAAGGATIDKAGVTLVGWGRGTKRPTFTLGTATTADFLISSARCTLTGLNTPWGRQGGFRFVSNINDLGMILDVNAGECTISDCDFISSSAKEYLCAIDLATTMDDFVIRNCRFLQPTDPEGTDAAVNTGCIYVVDSENILIENCHAYGNFETAFLHNKTTAAKNVVVRDCFIYSSLATSVPFELVDGCTGVASRITGATPAATDATEALVYGTLGTTFWIHDSGVGNDSGGGGQGGIGGTVAS